MSRTTFEALRVIRREWESDTGCSEVCAGPDGVQWIRLRMRDPKCQREFLAGCPPIPVQLCCGTLEAILPFREGMPLRQWTREHMPGFKQRRDACLSVVAQCVGDCMPAGVIALSALPGNLRFSSHGAWLQLLPDWGAWRAGLTESDAVRAVAVLCRALLAPACHQRRWLPPELRLLIWRADCADYREWGQLQRDLAALPEAVPGFRHQIPALLHGVKSWLSPYTKPAIYAVTAILLAAALLSLAVRYKNWSMEQEEVWLGITSIGDQELVQEEMGAAWTEN